MMKSNMSSYMILLAADEGYSFFSYFSSKQ